MQSNAKVDHPCPRSGIREKQAPPYHMGNGSNSRSLTHPISNPISTLDRLTRLVPGQIGLMMLTVGAGHRRGGGGGGGTGTYGGAHAHATGTHDAARGPSESVGRESILRLFPSQFFLGQSTILFRELILIAPKSNKRNKIK